MQRQPRDGFRVPSFRHSNSPTFVRLSFAGRDAGILEAVRFSRLCALLCSIRTAFERPAETFLEGVLSGVFVHAFSRAASKKLLNWCWGLVGNPQSL